MMGREEGVVGVVVARGVGEIARDREVQKRKEDSREVWKVEEGKMGKGKGGELRRSRRNEERGSMRIREKKSRSRGF